MGTPSPDTSNLSMEPAAGGGEATMAPHMFDSLTLPQSVILDGVAGEKVDEAIDNIRVEVSKEPLSDSEKQLLIPDLEARGLSTGLLDVLPPEGKIYHLLRAYSGDRLLGITVMMSHAPFVAMKIMLGEGNHVGWDNSFYFTAGAPKQAAIAAMLKTMGSNALHYAYYLGTVDADMRASLTNVPHRLFTTSYRCGYINTRGMSDAQDFLAKHRCLRRHLKKFAKAGGAVYIKEGPLDTDLARQFSECVITTYRYHAGKKAKYFEKYAAETCLNFYLNCEDAVHFYTEEDGLITGCQTFVRHGDYLELSEGGFHRDRNTHHAYDAIIAETVEYAIQHGLKKVSYGMILNQTKDRYMEKADREKVYLLIAYNKPWKFRVFGRRVIRRMSMKRIVNRFAGGSMDFELVSEYSGQTD